LTIAGQGRIELIEHLLQRLECLRDLIPAQSSHPIAAIEDATVVDVLIHQHQVVLDIIVRQRHLQPNKLVLDKTVEIDTATETIHRRGPAKVNFVDIMYRVAR
jgi:hypothetical protein